MGLLFLVPQIFLGVHASVGALCLSRAYDEARSGLSAQMRLARLRESAGKGGLAEVFSLQHQSDLLQGLNGKWRQKALALGLDERALQDGMVDSDLGKLSDYRRLLHVKSRRSDRLLTFLKGKSPGPVGQALRRILDRNGYAGKTLLPRHLSNAQIRSEFSRNGALRSFLHELPGLVDAIEAFEAGRISEDLLEKRVFANLGHNGPMSARSFWKQLAEESVTYPMWETEAGKNFFRNTVFDSGNRRPNGVLIPTYPMPRTFEGLVHCVLDRLSQGTRGGITKFHEEVRPFGTDPISIFVDLTRDNPSRTIDQLEHLRRHVPTARVSREHAEFLVDFIDAAVERLKDQERYWGERVDLDEAVGTRGHREPDHIGIRSQRPDGRRLEEQFRRIQGERGAEFTHSVQTDGALTEKRKRPRDLFITLLRDGADRLFRAEEQSRVGAGLAGPFFLRDPKP